ncbi:MAG: hypothetical protein CL917_10815 [Deltaproteobacteria bacterium]|nr:hypothetical protein [Deltaproteobacteria bacterium]
MKLRLRRAFRTTVILLTLFGLGCAGHKESPPPAVKPVPPRVLAAEKVVDRLHVAMAEIMKSGPELGYEGREALLMQVSLEVYDFPAMASLSYGPTWSDLTVEQQAMWIEIYTQFHVSSEAEVRNVYRGQTYRMLGYREVPDGHVLIETQLDYPGRSVDFFTNYLLRLSDGQWRIIDIFSPPSVSEVAMRRAEYRTVLEKSGYSGLVDDMEKRMKGRK